MSRHGQIVKKICQEHRQELVKLIKQAAYMNSTWRIWDDLMYMGAAALAQPCQWVQEREDEYLRRIGQYDKQTKALFPKMFGEIILAFEQEGCVDILGNMYMQLELSNHWKGQFFTPDSVCKVMAQITYGKDELTAAIEKQGFITVNDPCCGGGAMLIAFADTCMKHKIDFQRDVLFVGQDIDPVVARMCYISMSLLGMPGYIIIGNSLLNPPTIPLSPDCDVWYTPMYFIHGFQWRRQRDISLEDEAVEAAEETPVAALQDTQALMDTGTPESEEIRTEAAAVVLPMAVEYNVTKVGQLTLF